MGDILQGKVVVVTGGSGGIRRAIAIGAAQLGAKVTTGPHGDRPRDGAA